MARDGGEIRIKIGGDSSELEAASARAAKSLAGVGGGAAKAAKGVNKASTKMAKDARRMAKLSDAAENTKDEFGEMSSSAAALAAALDVVDPRLGSAARGLGDMAGAAEGAVRMTKLQGGALSMILNPAVLTVAASVAAMGGAYFLLSKELKDANAKLEEQDERMATLGPKIDQVKQSTLSLLVAEGEMTRLEMIEQLARKKGLALVAPERKAQEEKLQAARDLAAESTKRLEDYKQETKAIEIQLRATDKGRATLSETLDARDRQAASISETIEQREQSVASIRLEIEKLDRLGATLTSNEIKEAKLKEAGKKGDETRKEIISTIGIQIDALEAAQQATRDLMHVEEEKGSAIEEVQKAAGAMMNERLQMLETEKAAEVAIIQAAQDEIALLKDRGLEEDIERIAALQTTIQEHQGGILSAKTRFEEDMSSITGRFNQQALDAFDEMEQANRDHLDRIAADSRAAEEEENAARQASRDLAISYGSEMSSALVDISSARLDALMAHGDQMTDQQKDQAMMQFGIMQASSVAQAIVSGYESAAKTMGTYGFPAGIPLAALAIAATGVQVAAIASTPAPSFATGGMVPGNGEVPITAHGGEGVLTAGTTASLGGAGGIDALNNGDITGQLGQIAANTNGLAGQIVGALESRPVQVQVTLGHKQFDKFINADLRRPKSRLRGALRGVGMGGITGAVVGIY